MSRSVLVIGGGIVGLCTAEALARRGFQVTVIERDPGGEGCSYINGGIIVPSHFVPLASPGMLKKGLKMLHDPSSPFGFACWPNLEMMSWMARFLLSANRAHVERAMPLLFQLNLASRNIYEKLIPRLGADVAYANRGCLMLCKTEETFEEEADMAVKADSMGMTVKVLGGSEVGQVDPGINMSVAGGVHFEDDAHLSPPLFMRAMQEHLDRIGVCRKEGSIVGFYAEGGSVKVAHSHEGEIEADEFVIAAGAWSRDLFLNLGLNLPLLSGRGYAFNIVDPLSQPKIPSILVEARIAMTPMPEGIHFVGALELGPPVPPTNEHRVEGMRARIPDYYPGLDFVATERPQVGYGHRPCTPDGMPYLGRTRRYSNLTIATGHSMMGMSLGPVSGELVAQHVADEPPSIASDLLSPDRFG